MIEVITNSSVQAFTGAFQYGRADTEVFQNEIVTEIFSNEILTEIFQYEIVTEIFQYEIVTENSSAQKYWILVLEILGEKASDWEKNDLSCPRGSISVRECCYWNISVRNCYWNISAWDSVRK